MTNEIVTQKALAQELRAAPSSICQLVARGMPRRADGKLDRTACLRWITRNCIGSLGGWAGHMRGKPSLHERASAILAGADGQDGQEQEPLDASLAGAATACILFCTNVRESLPGLVADLSVSSDWSRTGQQLVLKCDMLALVDLLLRGWSEEVFRVLTDAGYDVKLPEVDFAPFGKHADTARVMFETMQRYWETGNAGEGTIAIPDDDEPSSNPKPCKAHTKSRK